MTVTRTVPTSEIAKLTGRTVLVIACGIRSNEVVDP
jgi:hypothetical protein